MAEYSQLVASIITDIFGGIDRIPVFDRSAYQIPDKFWFAVKTRIEDYEKQELQYVTFLNLEELSREMKFFGPFLTECRKFLDDETITSENLIERVTSFDTDCKALNEHLFEFLTRSGLKLDAGFIKQRHTSRFSMQKRKIVREVYVKFEEEETSRQFLEIGPSIDYPKPLMIDRIVFFVFSKDHLSHKKDVRDILKQNCGEFAGNIETEQAEYRRREFLEAGYTKEEVDMYCPVNLDDRFDLIKYRSVLDNYSLDNKPKKIRDGKGWSYIWRVGGKMYRFNYEPPMGRPVSLMVHANLQRLVWLRILEDHPEAEAVFQQEFLNDNNYIPLGYESLYAQYEPEVFAKLCRDIENTYKLMMGRLGFTEIDFGRVENRISQIEVCWNLPLPVDVANHLWWKYDRLSSIGLNPELNRHTPLLVTTFYSDVETGVKLFAHKEYRKSKKVFRNEVVFTNGLKNEAFILPAKTYGASYKLPPKSMSISDWLLTDLQTAKKYLFFKLHRRYGLITGTVSHGYYDWRNSEVFLADSLKKDVLKSVLLKYPDLPDWLIDLDVFETLIDYDFIQRRFFRNFTEKEFRYRVRENPSLFEKIGHGRYRLKHPAVLEYRKVRDLLSHKNDFAFIDSSMEKINGGN